MGGSFVCGVDRVRRGGVIPLDQITAIRWETLGRPRNQNYVLAWRIRIEARDRRPLRFVANPGMAAFPDEVKAAAPHVKVKLPPVIAWTRAGYCGPFRGTRGCKRRRRPRQRHWPFRCLRSSRLSWRLIFRGEPWRVMVRVAVWLVTFCMTSTP